MSISDMKIRNQGEKVDLYYNKSIIISIGGYRDSIDRSWQKTWSS